MEIQELIKVMPGKGPGDKMQNFEWLTPVLEFWATNIEKEVDDQLLKQLVIDYAAVGKKLSEVNQLKNKFLGMTAHDLRNPIAAIRGNIELFLTEAFGPLTPKQKERLQTIFKMSDQMLTMVDDLLDVAVIDSGKMILNLKKENLTSLAKERIQIISPIAQKKEIKIYDRLTDSGEIFLDAQRIGQVLDNFLSNAVKFSPPNRNIYVGLVSKNNKVGVCVRDEGPGISENDRVHLFKDFQTLTARPTGGEKSSGLGLAIVKKIIDSHRGSLEVVNESPAGSSFCFYLPK